MSFIMQIDRVKGTDSLSGVTNHSADPYGNSRPLLGSKQASNISDLTVLAGCLAPLVTNQLKRGLH